MDDLTGIVFSRLSSLVIGGVTEQDGLIVRRAHDRAAWVVSACVLLPHSDMPAPTFGQYGWMQLPLAAGSHRLPAVL
jgi:hypothetical protein